MPSFQRAGLPHRRHPPDKTVSTAQASVNVDVNVGEPLAANVDLLPLPPSIVSVVPEYRGYDYVVVHDEIVIMQPSTRTFALILAFAGDSFPASISRCFMDLRRLADSGC